MKFKKIKTLNEAIAEVTEKDQGVVGPVYADAVRQAKNVRDLIDKKFKERKIETPNEDRFAHTGKIKGTPEQKKMELTESLFTEWVDEDEEDYSFDVNVDVFYLNCDGNKIKKETFTDVKKAVKAAKHSVKKLKGSNPDNICFVIVDEEGGAHIAQYELDEEEGWIEVFDESNQYYDEEDLDESLEKDQRYPIKSPIAEDIEGTSPISEEATADSSSPLQFAEEPISLKNIIVKNDDKGDLVYVKEDGTQVELKGLEVEEVELTENDLFTNQQTVNQEKLDNFIKSVDELPPVVVVMDDEGKYHILDGNHRSIAFIESGREVPAYAYLLSEIEEKLAEEGITTEDVKTVTSEVKDGLTEQKWLTLKDMEITTPDNHIIKVAVTAPASVIMAVEKDDVNNGIDSGLYDRDGLILDDYFLMMESESGISSNKYADYLKAMGKNVDEDVQDCQKFPVDFKKSKVLNELTENLDSETMNRLNSEVYNALMPIVNKYLHKGLTLRDVEIAVEFFIIHLADEIDDNLDENLEDSQRYPIEKPKAKDSQFISAKDKQPTQHINAKNSQFVSAGDKDPKSVGMINESIIEDDEDKILAMLNNIYLGEPLPDGITEADVENFNTNQLADIIYSEDWRDDPKISDALKAQMEKSFEEHTKEPLSEGSFQKNEGNEYFAKKNRGPLADVIQMTLSDGEWGYVKSPDGTITPTLLPHLSLSMAQIGIDWDKDDRMYITAPVTDVVSEEDIINVANRFHKEYKVETSHKGKKYVHIYVNEDEDFDGNYIGDDFPVNDEGIKGRGTGKRGNPSIYKDVDEDDANADIEEALKEEIQPEQKYPIESPIYESLEANGIDLETYICNDSEAQITLDIIRDQGKLQLFKDMLEDQYLNSLTSEDLEKELSVNKERWLKVLNILKNSSIEEE